MSRCHDVQDCDCDLQYVRCRSPGLSAARDLDSSPPWPEEEEEERGTGSGGNINLTNGDILCFNSPHSTRSQLRLSPPRNLIINPLSRLWDKLLPDQIGINRRISGGEEEVVVVLVEVARPGFTRSHTQCEVWR